MLHSGIGKARVNGVLPVLGILLSSTTTLKKHERFVGMAVERAARQSCTEQMLNEIEQTSLKRTLSLSSSGGFISHESVHKTSSEFTECDELPAEKLELYCCLFAEGYDIPDPDYEKWRESFTVSSQAGSLKGAFAATSAKWETLRSLPNN